MGEGAELRVSLVSDIPAGVAQKGPRPTPVGRFESTFRGGTGPLRCRLGSGGLC